MAKNKMKTIEKFENTINQNLRKLNPKGNEASPKKKQDIAPKKLLMLVLIVNRSKEEFYIDILQEMEANIQMSINARGTADSEMLQYLGLTSEGKRAIFTVIREDNAEKIMKTLGEKFETVNNGKGVAYTVPLTSTIGVAIYSFLSNNRKAVKEN